MHRRHSLVAIALTYGCSPFLDVAEPQESENTDVLCTNGLDDDFDGVVDCGDPSCRSLDGCDPARAEVFSTQLRIRYRRAPWGGGEEATGSRARLSIDASETSARVGLFDRENIDGVAPIAEVVVGPSPTTTEVPGGPPRLYYAPISASQVEVDVPRGEAFVDMGPQSGTQAKLVDENQWIASIRGKLAGQAFPNPHRLSQGVFHRGLRAPDFVPAREATGAELGGVLSSEGVSTRYRRAWRRHIPLIRGPVGSEVGATWDPVRGLGVVFGGFRGSALDATWLWDGFSWREAASTVRPPARLAPALSAHPGLGGVVLFGGSFEVGLTGEGQLFGDLWLLDEDGWRELEPEGPGPSPRRAPAMAYDEARGRLVVFGGCADLFCEGELPRDTWELVEGRVWERRELTEAPPGRNGGQMFYDPRGRRMLLFGGSTDITSDSPLADVWAYDGEEWTQLAEANPELNGRFPSSEFIRSSGTLVVTQFGPDLDRTEVHLFDGATWSRAAETGLAPFQRLSAQMFYDRSRDEIAFVAGID
ncbi:MAG: hypothetical protein AAFU79_05465, partial [Myxococcota bacterium]